MRIRRGLAALLAALLLAALLPSALAEPAEDSFELETYSDEDADLELEVELAEDAGDTGLTIEAGDAPDEAAAQFDPDDGEAEFDIELVTADEAGTAGDAGDEAADDAVEALDLPEIDDDGEGLEILALPAVDIGYAAVAPEAPVYADAALTQAVGVFPDGAAVYVEAVEDDGALLKIRFDTEDSRGWNEAVRTGYIYAGDALAYTDAEAKALEKTLAADGRTRRLNGVAIPCVRFEEAACAVLSGEAATGLGVDYHTQAEIQAFINAHPSNSKQINIYSVAARDEPYSVGKLSSVNQQSALNMLNHIRYIAGLDASVSLLTSQENAMAATALVLRLYSEQYRSLYGSNILTHFPPRASAIADSRYDSLYEQGYTGAGRSNIAMGYSVTISLLAYMSDADDTNIRTVGHRRWILNPAMGQTVFGANGRFSAMFAHDMSGSGGQTKVAWPAQQMPRQYFNATDPWSLSYGRTLSADKVSVSLVRVRDGKTWNFSSAKADGFFAVENSAYGQRGCVIFRPDGLTSIADGDIFNVSVNDGETGELTRYTVRFFTPNLDACDPLDLPESVTALKTRGGNELKWSAVSGAKGYYVCRRSSASSNYQIVADVKGTSYKDADVFEDLDYYYQIYAHTASLTSRSAVTVQAAPVPPDAVKLNRSGTVKLYKNATLQLTASFEPSYAMAKLTWKSSKKKIATVDDKGLVTPLRAGTTVISVTADNGRKTTVKIKVKNPPKARKVVLSAKGTIELNVGETLQVSGTVQPAEAIQKLTWKSSRKKIASVSKTGLITALRQGKATITAKSASGKTARLKIKVTDPSLPDSVSLNYTGTVWLEMGKTLQLKGTILPDTARTTLTWKSSKKKIASVDRNGLVTARKKGTAIITVTTANGKKAKVKIKVVKRKEDQK